MIIECVMFIENKYYRIYFSLMEKSKDRTLSGCIERHHIIPRSLGGSDEPSNLAVLTAREHYIAHLLLTRMVAGTDRRKMAYALLCFNRPNPRHSREKINSRTYQYIRELLSTLPVSKETGDKISKALKGRKRSPEVCANLSEKLRGRVFSEETRNKMRDAKLGTTASDSTRKKMSEARKGKLFSGTHKQNIRNAYQKTNIRTNAIIEANKLKRKPCTVDGINIYQSKRALEEVLGRGKQGSRSPNFRFLEK